MGRQRHDPRSTISPTLLALRLRKRPSILPSAMALILEHRMRRARAAADIIDVPYALVEDQPQPLARPPVFIQSGERPMRGQQS